MLRELQANELAQLRCEIDALGVARLPAMVGRDLLEALRHIVMAEAARAAPCDFSRREGFEGTLIAELVRLSSVEEMVRRVYRAAFGQEPPPARPFCVLRVIARQPSQRHAHKYHFDAYRLTVLLPIFVPDGDSSSSGDLIVFPHFRAPPRYAILNALHKSVLQNPVAWRIFAIGWLRRRLGGKCVKLVPGSLYVFDGLTTFHANDRCDPRALRATLLLHLDDPFERNPFFAYLKRRRAAWDRRFSVGT
jgi:hypothetical protein